MYFPQSTPTKHFATFTTYQLEWLKLSFTGHTVYGQECGASGALMLCGWNAEGTAPEENSLGVS